MAFPLILYRHGDGAVTPRDPAFSELALWYDHDGDRRALPGELMSLAAAGIDGLSLEFEDRRVCDARNNCGRERSAVTGTAAELGDLYLPCRR